MNGSFCKLYFESSLCCLLLDLHNTGNNGGEPGNEDGQWSEKQISCSPGFAGKNFL